MNMSLCGQKASQLQKGCLSQKLRSKEAIVTEHGSWSLVVMAKRETSEAAEQPLAIKRKQSRADHQEG